LQVVEQVVEQQEVVKLVVVEVELEDIELLVMALHLYKDLHYLYQVDVIQ
jgi:hypothetical protein